MSKKSQFIVKLLKYKTMKNRQLERLQIPESWSRMLALTEPTNSPCVYVQLNMHRLGVIFTFFNTFRLILKERSEMCRRDGRLGVWCETGDVVH